MSNESRGPAAQAVFTPGPWEINRGKWLVLARHAPQGPAAIDWTPVAFLGEGISGSKDTKLANAQLIVAAPDLYAALLDAEVLVDTRSPLAPDVLAKIRAALAKAEGRSAAQPPPGNSIAHRGMIR